MSVAAGAYVFGSCARVRALREKQLIIEFNRRNTVYPQRHKASRRETEGEGRQKSQGEVEADDLGTAR